LYKLKQGVGTVAFRPSGKVRSVAKSLPYTTEEVEAINV
jgi:hypothetical protein